MDKEKLVLEYLDILTKLQDLAFEGVDSYKRKIVFADKNMCECIKELEDLVSSQADVTIVESCEESIQYWKNKIKDYEMLHADALKLYKETFCKYD